MSFKTNIVASIQCKWKAEHEAIHRDKQQSVFGYRLGHIKFFLKNQFSFLAAPVALGILAPLPRTEPAVEAWIVITGQPGNPQI